jgi:hypothetical protein
MTNPPFLSNFIYFIHILQITYNLVLFESVLGVENFRVLNNSQQPNEVSMVTGPFLVQYLEDFRCRWKLSTMKNQDIGGKVYL